MPSRWLTSRRRNVRPMRQRSRSQLPNDPLDTPQVVFKAEIVPRRRRRYAGNGSHDVPRLSRRRIRFLGRLTVRPRRRFRQRADIGSLCRSERIAAPSTARCRGLLGRRSRWNVLLAGATPHASPLPVRITGSITAHQRRAIDPGYRYRHAQREAVTILAVVRDDSPTINASSLAQAKEAGLLERDPEPWQESGLPGRSGRQTRETCPPRATNRGCRADVRRPEPPDRAAAA